MKRAWMMSLALAAGCSSISESEPAAAKPESVRPAPPPSSPKEAQLSSVRSQLAMKKADQSQAAADLDRISAEREQLSAAEASASKTNRLAELATLESEAKRKKQALALDIADLDARLKDLTAGGAASDDPLAAALAEDASAEREKADRRRTKDEADRAVESRRIAEAESARRAEAELRSKEKIAGGRIAQVGDGTAFEDRWADVILKVRETLQQFKRW